MRTEQPLVTVVCLCFNTGEFVLEALECVRRQTYSNIQLIIIDDGSSDDSVALIQRWLSSNQDPVRRHLICNTSNQGIPAAFNQALAIADGSYVTWISDDLWEHDRLQTTIDLFEKLPDDVAVMFGDMLVIDQQGKPGSRQSPYTNLIELSFVDAQALAPNDDGYTVLPKGLVRRALFHKCFFAAPTVTVRRKLYSKIGRYDVTLYSEDIDCWFRAAEHFDFVYVQKPLVKYRVHQTNASLGRNPRYMEAIQTVLHRHLTGSDPRSCRIAIRRHLREEAYRTSQYLLANRARGQALRYVWKYYIPNFQWSKNSLKETARLLIRLILPLRSPQSTASRLSSRQLGTGLS